ncbi:hypothetical protein [Chondromyces apiculatus]|uniref:hypothetical protein n=1 Tax=Chondromyces apiculatus TaxID=51 RepID=UPI0012DEEC94|nr:hypothetical protein [Chondromyces apiculatus]
MQLPTSTDEEVRRIEAALHALFQAGRVKSARQLLEGLDPNLKAAPQFAKWFRALGPAVANLGAPGNTPSIKKNAAWLEANAMRHFGNWVALREGVLLGSDPDHVTLHRDLKQRGELHGAVFVCIKNG